jgi:hypothetical protein
MANPTRKTNLVSKAVGDGLALFDPQQQRAHVLNPTSAQVYQHCDGQTTPQQLTELLRIKFNLPRKQAERLVWLALEELEKAELLQASVATTQPPRPSLSRRQALKAFAAAGLSLALMPIVSSKLVTEAQFSTVSTTTAAPPPTTTTPAPTTTTPAPTTTTPAPAVPPAITAVAGPIDPVSIDDQPIGVGVEFSAGTSPAIAVEWDWGDGDSDTETGATSPASAGHTYADPGVYEVTVTVSGADGSDSATLAEYVVIYDPSGGFVTGGGWIMSPAGAYAADETLTGKANFGFNSKYKKGATVPSGNTNFQFKAGDLHFKSTSYDWLVVPGQDKAKYKGSGTINGGGNYGFMLTAKDSSPDTFRIKIWNKDDGDALVYDNKLGADDDGYDGTALGGGNIKVHKAK